MEESKRDEKSCVAADSKPMSPQDLDILRSLDSLSYGLLDLHSRGGGGGGGGGGRGGGRESLRMSSITRDLIQQGITHLRGSVAQFSYSPHSQAQIISQIAHLHLLLEEFTHAYSAYTQYRRLSPSSESDPSLFYGLGIIHCHHGQLKHSEEAYRKVLSLAPSFPRSGEVHLQLGLLIKKRKAYDDAITHLETALSKQDPQLDKFLIQFHLAHVSELLGHSSEARSKYEVLLGCRTLSPHVKALTQKQLGWLLHSCPNAVKPGEEGVGEKALELLKQAAQAMPKCGETWYLLGRVLVIHQQYHEAFTAYQKTIRYPSSISPANAWHSIGHLYFQMQQPRDSLQAYICCVYLEIHHLQGWKSLGCLYEAVVYPIEALLCYQNAMVAFTKKNIKLGTDMDYVQSRITALRQYLSMIGRPYIQNPGMPQLHEAWLSLVPDHIRKRQPNPGTPILSLHQCNDVEVPSASNALPFLPPNYCPQDCRQFGGVSNGNFLGQAVFTENESKPPQRKRARKKPLAVRSSTGSTPSPPVFTSTIHSTPNAKSPNAIQNRNGTVSGITPMECSLETTPSKPRRGSDADMGSLNGINLDNLDFDALSAAASALPSPASLAARSRVRVTSTKTKSISPPQVDKGNPTTSLSPPSSSVFHYTTSGLSVTQTTGDHTLAVQASSHQGAAAITTVHSSTSSFNSTTIQPPHCQSAPTVSTHHPPLTTNHTSSPSLSTTTPSINSSLMVPTQLPPKCGYSTVVGPLHSGISNGQVTNTSGSLGGNTAASHTSDTVSGQQSSSASALNLPSYLIGEHKQPAVSSNPVNSQQLQPLTTSTLPVHPATSQLGAHKQLGISQSLTTPSFPLHPTTSHALRSYLMEAPKQPVVNSRLLGGVDPQHAQSLTMPIPLYPTTLSLPSESAFRNSPPVVPSPTLKPPMRSLSLVEGRERKGNLGKIDTRRRRSSVNSSLKSPPRNRRRSETGIKRPRSASSGFRVRMKSSDEISLPLTPLPENMASDPSLLSQMQAASLSASSRHVETPFLSGLNQTTGTSLGPLSGATIGQNGCSHSGLQDTTASGSTDHNPTLPFSNAKHDHTRSNQTSSGHNQMMPPLTTNLLSGVPLGHNICPTTLQLTTVTNPPSSIHMYSSHNQATAPLTTVTNASMGMSFAANGQTTPLLTTTSPNEPYSNKAPFGSHFVNSSNEHFTTKKPGVDPSSSASMCRVPMSPSQSCQSQFHSPINPTHKSQVSGHTESHTVHHHSSTSQPPSLPPTTFASLPQFSPPSASHLTSATLGSQYLQAHLISPTSKQQLQQTAQISPTRELSRQQTREPSLPQTAQILPTRALSQQQTARLSSTRALSQQQTALISPTVTLFQQQAAQLSPTRALSHQQSAQISPTKALSPQYTAQISPTRAQSHQQSAQISPTRARSHQQSAQISPTRARSHQQSAQISPTRALSLQYTAQISPTRAQSHQQSAQISPTRALSQQHTGQISPTRALSQQHTGQISPTRALSQQHTGQISPTRALSQQHTGQISPTRALSQQHTGQISPTRALSQQHTGQISPTRALSQQHTGQISPTRALSQQHTGQISPTRALSQQHTGQISPTRALSQQHTGQISPTRALSQQHTGQISPTRALSQQHTGQILPTRALSQQHTALLFPTGELSQHISQAGDYQATPALPIRTQSMTDLGPEVHVGSTMTVLTSEIPTTCERPVEEQSASNPPLTSPLPISSVQSLVNQLFSVLQQKDDITPVSTREAVAADSLSDSSSGISSAGTTMSALSTTSTADSSPVEPRSATTPSLPTQSPAPLSCPSVQQQPLPSLPSPPSPTLTSPVSPSHCHDHQPNTELHKTQSLNIKPTIMPPHVPFPSLASVREYMILEPELRPPNPPPFQLGMELRPECPVYKVTSYEDAVSTRLHEFCNNPSNPICIIKGLVEAVGLDLSLFSSQCLVETCPDHEMEVREQMKQAADENCDVVTGKQVWKCESSKSITTVIEYARYQQKMLQKELEEKDSGHVSDTEQRVEKGEREFLSFGTNVDISDEDIWSDQLEELYKLPQFLRVTCPETNLLSHIGHTILGMNSVQLYMKVASSRTPGHQENNNFCSLNINIGPGTCEWFAVPNSCWGVLHNLCEKHKVNFLVGSWWPVLEELYRHNVPVYRFTQYKGDVVFINPGTVHWVQANSTCNNIAWNTGPLTAHQFRMAWERYQWNKVQNVRSIVPMIHLTWHLARHIRITDPHFYSQVRSLLESSLAQTNLLLSHLQRAGVPVVWHGRLDGEPAPYCNNCMEEVFNILFVLSHRGEYLVYCHRCASSMRKTFTVLQQYQTDDLEAVVTAFKHLSPDT